MKKLFNKIRDKGILLWVLIILIGFGNTVFYSFNYYQQTGLEFNLLNSISIDGNIAFDIIMVVSIVYLFINNKKMVKKIDEVSKMIEDVEDNVIAKSTEAEIFVMELLKKIKE